MSSPDSTQTNPTPEAQGTQPKSNQNAGSKRNNKGSQPGRRNNGIVTLQQVIDSFNQNPARGTYMISASKVNTSVIINNSGVVRGGLNLMAESDRVIGQLDRRFSGISVELMVTKSQLEMDLTTKLGEIAVLLGKASFTMNEASLKSDKQLYDPLHPAVKAAMRVEVEAKKQKIAQALPAPDKPADA
jgi:hypothetical protein